MLAWGLYFGVCYAIFVGAGAGRRNAVELLFRG